MLDIESKVILVVRDKHNKEIKRKEAKGNTILKNFMRLIEHIFKAPIDGSSAMFIDINGTSHLYHYSYPLYVNGNKIKIAIGSDNTPVSFNDYNLGNILKGWEDVISYEVSYDDVNFKGTFKAYKSWTFTEETDIWEAGLAFPYYKSSELKYAMVDRIVLDEAFTVPANKTIDVYYILEFSKK